ncbi:DUF2933 domain-containing protein [Falsiroseomonas stagni]|uniref:DUF2933 domain-containing protein n=2 Tax=Falsiroseomonas TaxID=2870713 RepID=A0A1I4F954_9PROT|nr:DUF2933 domain-containing protein [Falsiroseomonas stagni]SFL14512.1 Protein of unknown function [Falsiroseomonas stagni DSM 19981]
MVDQTNLGSLAKHLMPGSGPVWWRTRAGIAVIGFALIAAFYVLREHWGHAFGALPYLILLACPLMHLFMHHGHGDGGGLQAGPDRGAGAK